MLKDELASHASISQVNIRLLYFAVHLTISLFGLAEVRAQTSDLKMAPQPQLRQTPSTMALSLKPDFSNVAVKDLARFQATIMNARNQLRRLLASQRRFANARKFGQTPQSSRLANILLANLDAALSSCRVLKQGRYTSALDRLGRESLKIAAKSSGARRLDILSDAVRDTHFTAAEIVREAKAIREDVRNRRQQSDAAFANFDRKVDELFTVLSDIQNAMKQMRRAVSRNLL